MKLDERAWIYGGGATSEWKRVCRSRVKESLSRLEAAGKSLARLCPAEIRRSSYAQGLGYFLRNGGPQRDRLAAHPALDYWLFLWDKHFSQGLPSSVDDWRLQLGLFQCFPAWLALERGDALRLDSVLDPAARLTFYGTPYHIEFPKELARKPIRLRIHCGELSVDGSEVRLTLERMKALPPEGAALAAARLGRALEVAPGMIIEDQAWLMTHGVVMHGLAHPEGEARKRFAEVLKTALEEMSQRAPGLLEELLDMVSVIIPLENPMKMGSVSSSYVNMRGAICLSHAEDPVLQAETLIHEFCHQKMNQLMVEEPILLPGQSGQVFYSPWRKDARRLRGLMLGAHAFLNVARYLLSSLSRQSCRREDAVDMMVNVSSRLYQVETALRCLSFYGSFTEFGRRFLIGMWRELGLLHHGTQWFPKALVQEARDNCAKHRSEHALFDTGFHKSEGFVDKVKRAPFLTPGGVEKEAAPTAAAAPKKA